MDRKATAVWNGGIKDGKGNLTTESKVLSNTQYAFTSRFENGIGTNPEELIAAAHAGCFTMDLSGRLERANMLAEKLETTATVTLGKGEKGFSITLIHLDVTAKVANPDQEAFQAAVTRAKESCPVSRLLNTEITISAKLV